MRPPFLLVVLVLSQGLDGELADYSDYDSSDIYGINNFTIDEEDVNTHLEIQATLQHFQECRDKKWSCDRDCRLEFRQKTSKCQQPFPHDKCFGIPINYKYTRDHNIGRFPIELGVLSRYPRCWSYLGPLICATIFRPCSRHHFIEKEENGSVENGTIELWQLLGSSLCEKAVQMCDQVISAGLFPSFIRCKDVNNANTTEMKSRPLYSKKCQHSIDDYPVKIDDGTCPWPLISESSSLRIDSTPLLDDCYLPCRSPLVSPPLSDRFRGVRFFICTLLTILFFSESIFLSRFCKLFAEQISLFYISHAVICAATYCLIWSLSYFDTFFTLSECSIGGISRRFALSHSIFEWCSIQSIILYGSFLAAHIWLVLLYANAVCPPVMILLYFSPRSFRISRLYLISCVYGVSVIISFFVVSSLRENDGVSGVCHNGLLTWWKYLASIFPLVCIASILISIVLIFLHKRKEIMNRLALRHALAELNGAENQGYAEHFARFEMDGDVVSARVPGAVNGPLSIDIHARENQGLLREDPHQQMFWSVYNRNQRLVSERLRRERNAGISVRWTGASFMLFMLFLVLSPLIHYHHVAMPARYEEESIADYITCHLTHTIRNRSVEWITQREYPLPTHSHDASWCSLPFKPARDRLEGILVVFIILPVLPILVLLWAFLAGVNGYGDFGKNRNGDSEFSKKPIDFETCEAIPMKPVVVHESDVEAALINLRVMKASSMEAVDETQNKSPAESRDVETGDSTSVVEGDSESRKEYQEELMKIINKIHDELAFQQSMLVTDGAAWNISLYYMRRIDQLLSKLQSSDFKADRIYKELQTFGDEMSRVVPSVSGHVMQLSRWMDSVRETCLNLEHIRSGPNEVHQYPVGSEDISRQQELIALNEYIMRMAASTSNHHESPQACTTSGRGSTVQQENANPDPLSAEQMKEQPKEQISTASREHYQRHNSIEDQQPGPSRGRQDEPEMVSPADRRPGVHMNGNAAVPSQQSGRTRQILRISAYAESYSATPQGILTRLTVPELRIRVQQIKNICAGDSLYPQELCYMLLVTGDITFGGNTAREDLHLYTMEQLPSIFGANVPSIDARIGVQDFLIQMRRRALCVVAAIGYHFSLHHRRGLEYTPPVLPPLGLYRSENELILRRVLGDNDDVLPSLRGFLQEFQFGRGPVVPRLDLRFATAFRNYLCLVAAREGFDDNIEEYVSDPDPPQEPSNAQANVDDSDQDNDPDF